MHTEQNQSEHYLIYRDILIDASAELESTRREYYTLNTRYNGNDPILGFLHDHKWGAKDSAYKFSARLARRVIDNLAIKEQQGQGQRPINHELEGMGILRVVVTEDITDFGHRVTTGSFPKEDHHGTS